MLLPQPPKPRPYLLYLPARIRAFTAVASDAGGAGCAEDGWGDGSYLAEHLYGHLPDFPLGTVTAPYTEEVEEFPGVHGNDYLGLGGVGEEESCVFVNGLHLVARSA